MRTSAHSPDRGGSGGWNLMLTETTRRRIKKKNFKFGKPVVHSYYLLIFSSDELLCFAKEVLENLVENILVWIEDGNFPN